MVLHPPSRLQIAALLAKVSEMEFAKLRELTKVSDSVLSKHLSALVDAGYVRLRKAATGGRQRTWESLTAAGRRALARHVAALRALVAHLPMAE
ncbi:transcriptional regulator [Sphingobium sp. AS12]|uniref:transcriptional regulator n=1 Tax=Sphingobium sp. AS12 TaxID=2849495 RepID=UPI0020C8B340|nr:transcriptional regulator [Sphingobium sp. AS12]